MRDWHESARGLLRHELLEFELEEALEKPHIVILGDPGSGKSTLLQYLAWSYATSYDEADTASLLPILLRLATLVSCGCSLREAVFRRVRTMFPLLGDSEHQDLLESLMTSLADRRAILLLDGLDEVPKGKRAEVVETLLPLTALRIVVTSRYIGYNDDLSPFEHLDLAALPEEAQAQMISGWFGADDAKTHGLQSALSANDRIRALGTNPLLLTIICYVFEQEGRLPRYRHQLYNQATRRLLSIQDRHRSGLNLEVSSKILVLSRLCTEFFPPGYDEFEDTALFNALVLICGSYPDVAFRT